MAEPEVGGGKSLLDQGVEEGFRPLGVRGRVGGRLYGLGDLIVVFCLPGSTGVDGLWASEGPRSAYGVWRVRGEEEGALEGGVASDTVPPGSGNAETAEE